MGIKDNFEKGLNKAIEGKDKMWFKSLLKNAKNLEEKENIHILIKRKVKQELVIELSEVKQELVIELSEVKQE